eukprot:SAG25_NODE_204_length_11947_cov_29.018822_7_plen_175_part_00
MHLHDTSSSTSGAHSIHLLFQLSYSYQAVTVACTDHPQLLLQLPHTAIARNHDFLSGPRQHDHSRSAGAARSTVDRQIGTRDTHRAACAVSTFSSFCVSHSIFHIRLASLSLVSLLTWALAAFCCEDHGGGAICTLRCSPAGPPPDELRPTQSHVVFSADLSESGGSRDTHRAI